MIKEESIKCNILHPQIAAVRNLGKFTVRVSRDVKRRLNFEKYVYNIKTQNVHLIDIKIP